MPKKIFLSLILICALCHIGVYAQKPPTVNIAAAADLKFALDEINSEYKKAFPDDVVNINYGSSGKFSQQIENGAPFDLFFSASIDYPNELNKKGFSASKPKVYALGRIVLWSAKTNGNILTLKDITNNKFKKVAIANPDHAPYGVKAKEALKFVGLWQDLQAKIVFGENISHTAQLIESGAADIGIIALSLALNPQLANKGGFYLIPKEFHTPLEQAFVITKRAENNLVAHRFVKFMESVSANEIMVKYGFELK